MKKWDGDDDGDEMVSSDQSGRSARISRGFSAVHEPLAQLSNILHCPVNATTHGQLTCTRRAAQSFSKLRGLITCEGSGLSQIAA